MPSADPDQTLEQYEVRAVAHYFAHEVHFPYVSVMLLSLVAAWLMWGSVPTTHIVLWLVLSTAANLLREVFVRHMRPRLANGQCHHQLILGFVVSAFFNGVTWGTFAWLYFDAQSLLTVVVIGSYLAGHVGGAVTPLAIYLPAFYAFLLPTLLPYVALLAVADTPMHYVLSGLTLLFLMSMAGYARLTHRLHHDGIRLRFENQLLIRDLEFRKTHAEDATRIKSQFLAGVSHDLKQPIQAISLYGAVIRRQAGDSAAVCETADKIELAAAEVQRQIHRLLQLSRLESDNLETNPESLDLSDCFAQLRVLFAEQARVKGLRLRLVPPRRSLRVLVDAALLQSVLQNLVSNAVKFTDAGSVYVGTRWQCRYPGGRQLCIEVRDSGRGIPKEHVPTLFDAYRSFDDRAGAESHGLGLAITRAQASQMGCAIDVCSAPGAGSTFTLSGLRIDTQRMREDRPEELAPTHSQEVT